MIRIKSWAKFQHFKDRRPPWVKLYRDLLDDKEWHKLDATAAKLLVSLWLIASEYDGELPDTETLAFRTRLSERDVTESISRLSHWLEQSDIAAISDGCQGDPPETETETETETEAKREADRASSARLSKAKKSGLPKDFAVSDRVRAWAKEKGFGKLDQHLEAFIRKATAKGYSYVDWDSAFMEAIREDWAKLRGRTPDGAAPGADGGDGEWHDTKAGIEARAAVLGLQPYDGLEQFPAYKARVMAAHQKGAH